MTSLPPVVRQLEVATDPARAFELWTAQVGSWWPMATHSVHGAEATVAFTDGRLVETGPDGSTSDWGTVLTWDPPHLLTMTWHPGRDATEATQVEVRFEPVEEHRTRVILTHSGWEARAESEQVRESYDTGWAVVLGAFAETYTL
jgi:hypothetical protein